VSRYNEKLRSADRLDQEKNLAQVENLMEIVDDVKKEADYNFIDKLISEHFAQKLLTAVENFYRHKQTNAQDEAVSSHSEEEEEESDDEEQDYQK